MQSTLKNN